MEAGKGAWTLPCASAVRRTSSSSIFSRVVLASSSTSAAVRPLVGIGFRTASRQ